MSETLAFLKLEEEGDAALAQPSGDEATFGSKLASIFLSKETSEVLQGIRKLLAEYGQGLEFNNADLLKGVLTLEKFYVNYKTRRTGDVVKELSAVEIPRHFFKFAMAAYGWKGLNFFGKGAGYVYGKSF
jgi:hypothetical protein